MKTQQGLSLIELMISITLGLLLMAGVVQMFISSKTVYVVQKGMSGVQETGRLAMEFISRDLRMAGYMGCLKDDNEVGETVLSDETAANPATFGLTGLHMNFTTTLRGYNTTSTAAADMLPNGAAVDLGAGFVVKPNSDVLVIRGSNQRGVTIDGANTLTQAFGYTPDDTTEGFADKGIAVISDCQKGHIFQVDSAPLVAAKKITLTYKAWTESMLPDGPTSEIYSQGMILPVHTYVYFVATAAGSQQPSLWQKIDNQAAVELLTGVEDISVTYSINDGNTYVSAAAVGDLNWFKVKSVNIEILARELGAGTNDSPQPYTFKGVVHDVVGANAVTDRVLRQVFSATFGVRTRIQNIR